MSLSLDTMLAEQGKRNPAATAKLLPEQCLLQGTDEPGARVALLQSPILPVVPSPYLKKRNFPGLPVDKPHTRSFAVKNSSFLSLACPSTSENPPLDETSNNSHRADYALPLDRHHTRY